MTNVARVCLRVRCKGLFFLAAANVARVCLRVRCNGHYVLAAANVARVCLRVNCNGHHFSYHDQRGSPLAQAFLSNLANTAEFALKEYETR